MSNLPALLGLAAIIAVVFALVTFARRFERSGRLEVENQYAEHAAKNADKVADIATNDNPDAVKQRLRDGDF